MALSTNTLIQAKEITNGGILRIAPQNQQFNPDLLVPQIWIAEQTHVVDVLGVELYEDLKLQKNGVISNYNENCGCPIQQAYPDNNCYEDFWKAMLKRLCGIAVVYESLPFLWVKITNNGLAMNSTSHFESTDAKGLGVIQEAMRTQLTTLRELSKKYIKDNSSCFPLACCVGCGNSCGNCSCNSEAPKNKLRLFSPRKKY